MESLKNKDPHSLVYLDESGIDDNEVYPYGWGPKGKRIHAMKRAERNKRLSIISALNDKNLKAPFVFEGTCNRRVFEAYIKHILVPELIPGQTVIMDNASFHKGGTIKKIIEDAGCELLYLPAYSPDFNPIEHCWAPIKHHMRQNLNHQNDDLYQTAQFVFQKLLT